MVNMVDVSNDEQSDKPEGADFKIHLAGRDVWFRKINDSQTIMLERIRRRARRKIDEIGRDPGSDFEAKTRAVQDLIDRVYESMWIAINATIVLPEDEDFLEHAMLTRQLEMSDAMRIFAQGKDEPPADDAEPAAKPKPARTPRKAIPAKAAKKAAVAKKAVANARRTKQ